MTSTIPLTYNSYVSQIANMAVMQTQMVSGIVSGVDATFNTMIPQALNYAELRIQRDLDMLPSVSTNYYTIKAGTNVLQINPSDFVTVETLSISGTPLLAVSKEFLQGTYPTSYLSSIPQFFSMVGGDQSTGGNTYNNILIGPYPDQNYTISITGTQRLPSLYQYASSSTLAATGTTYISQFLPDLLIAASMIYVSNYQRNFSGSSNSPEMPGSYEIMYENLLKGAMTEESRKKFEGAGWTPYAPSPTSAMNR